MPNTGAEAEASSFESRKVIVLPYGDGDEPLGITIDLGDEDIANDGVPIVMGEPVEPPNVVIKKAEEIALVLGAYAADRPSLSGEKEGLALSVAVALTNIGCEIGAEQVRIISCTPVSRFAGLMPMGAGSDLAARFGTDFAEAIGRCMALSTADMLNARLGAVLTEAIGHDASCDLGDVITRMITRPLLSRKDSIADHLGEKLWKSYHEALRFQLGFTLAGLKAERDLVSPFLELFSQGNFPVGYLGDDSFLVVVA